MNTDVTRRTLLAGLPLAAGLAATPLVAATPGPAQAGRAAISDVEAMARLSDPATRARVRACVMGSCEKETVNIFYRLNIYGYAGDGNLIPFYTMNHLSISEWTPLADHHYQARTFECGVYCLFDTDEPLEEWNNPLTGEVRKVWQFLGGPFVITHGPDGMVAQGAELSPKPLRIEAYGGMVFVSSQAGLARPNPTSPAKYPKLSSGPIAYWDTVSSTGSPVAQAFDASIAAADSFNQFQNLGSWNPWMAMGPRPGRTYGRAVGTKIRSLGEIPAAALKGLHQYTPEIFDIAGWKQPRFDVQEYLDTQKG